MLKILKVWLDLLNSLIAKSICYFGKVRVCVLAAEGPTENHNSKQWEPAPSSWCDHKLLWFCTRQLCDRPGINPVPSDQQSYQFLHLPIFLNKLYLRLKELRTWSNREPHVKKTFWGRKRMLWGWIGRKQSNTPSVGSQRLLRTLNKEVLPVPNKK